jgi:predicted MFS family arabinose efflux permease
MSASFGHPVVGPVFAATGLTMFCAGFQAALYMLYTLRTLGLTPGAVGSIIAVGGVGALGGTFLARLLPRRLGLGGTLVLSLSVYQLGILLVPMAGMPFVPRGGAVVLLVAQQLFADAFFMTFFILATTLRQTLVPEEALGRVNAALQVVTGALLPLGALAAGPIAAILGVRETLWVGAALGLAGPLILAASGPLRRAGEKAGYFRPSTT